MPDYEFEPISVAKTILCRQEQGDSRVSLFSPLGEWEANGAKSLAGTGPSIDDSLFLLSSGGGDVYRLVTAWGEDHRLSSGELESAQADPLWQSADGICRHMDEDHSDTYPRFLSMTGAHELPETPMVMEWVERRGFFLRSGPDGARQSHWIPFPAPCDTPDDVRKTLIQMLRGVRT